MRTKQMNKTLWRDGHVFGGASKFGKVWIAAAYSDGGNAPADGSRTLIKLGAFKSRAHAYAAVCRRFGEICGKELRAMANAGADFGAVDMTEKATQARRDRVRRFLEQNPEVRIKMISGQPVAGSIAKIGRYHGTEADGYDLSQLGNLTPEQAKKLAEALAGRSLPARDRPQAREVKLLVDGKEHKPLKLFEHKLTAAPTSRLGSLEQMCGRVEPRVQGRSTFKPKKGRGGR